MVALHFIQFYSVSTFLELRLYVPFYFVSEDKCLCLRKVEPHEKMSRSLWIEFVKYTVVKMGKKYLCIVSTNEYVVSGK